MGFSERTELWHELGLLADPIRRGIIDLLLAGPLHVNAIAAELPVTQSAVSQQLAKLREAGMIRPERQGKFVVYGVNPPAMKRLVGQLDTWRERVALRAKASGINLEEARAATDVVDDKMDTWADQWDQHDPLTVGILLRLHLITRALRKNLAKVTARFGLNGSELRLLGLLERIGPPHASTLSELSKMALVSVPAVSKHVARIEGEGWIIRMPNPEDDRSSLIQLTDKGRRLLHRVMDYQRRHDLYPIYDLPKEKRLAMAGMTRELLKKLPT